MIMADPIPARPSRASVCVVEAFRALAGRSRAVVEAEVGRFERDGREYTIPRFTLQGPATNVPAGRVGLFAVVHGDEPAAAQSLLRLLDACVRDPTLAIGYELVCYPVCNPTGLEDGTRHNRAGLDLNREFWRGSVQPEVQSLERELRERSFDGLIALHADDTSCGLYGYAHGRVLNENLVAPALKAAARVLPCNLDSVIDGFPAKGGIVTQCFNGVLRPPPDQRPQPFEIIFETPGCADEDLQAEAGEVAVRTILAEYRAFISYAQDI